MVTGCFGDEPYDGLGIASAQEQPRIGPVQSDTVFGTDRFRFEFVRKFGDGRGKLFLR